MLLGKKRTFEACGSDFDGRKRIGEVSDEIMPLLC